MTAIIPASNRQKSLNRLIRSVKKSYPELKLMVADDSQEALKCGDATGLRLPAGAGRSAACNAMLARLRTPYFLLLDDCCEFSKETRIESLAELVAGDKLDVAGGDLTGCRRRLWFFVKRHPQPGHGTFEISGDSLLVQHGHRTVGEGYSWCDMVPNFYVARTDKVRNMGGWDPELMNDERVEFFFRGHRHGLRVGIAPEVSALIWDESQSASPEVAAPCMQSLAVAKMGLTLMTDLEGRTVKAPKRALAA